jgi:hypothetical protein
MVPLKELSEHKSIEDLATPPAKVVSVEAYYTNGHPGVEEPHYHIVLWHVANGEQLVAK